MKRSFALASLAVVPGLVAVACQSEPSDVGSRDDAGVVDARAERPAEWDAKGEDFCSQRPPFMPPVINPPRAPRALCANDPIAALAVACAKAPESDSCTNARTNAANAECGECIFGMKSDAEWKMIVLDPGSVPPARYNQAGCIDLAGNVGGCGRRYFTAVACFDHHCNDGCPPYSGDELLCQKEVAQASGPCKPFLIDEACGNALDAVEKTCFPGEQTDAAIEALFASMARVFCQRSMIVDAATDG